MKLYLPRSVHSSSFMASIKGVVVYPDERSGTRGRTLQLQKLYGAKRNIAKACLVRNSNDRLLAANAISLFHYNFLWHSIRILFENSK